MILEQLKLFSQLNFFSVLFRILLAFVLGGLLGIERERKHRPAGFRTYIIVCVGAALTSITNIYLFETMGQTDVTRLPAQVISGIGFLGAGTILVTRHMRITGLTTAAGLWCVATVGIAIGSGFYTGAIVTCLVIIFAFNFLTYVDKIFAKKNRYIRIYAEYFNSDFIKHMIAYARTHQYEVRELEVYPSKKGVSGSITCCVKISTQADKKVVLEDLWNMEGLFYLEEMGE